MHPDITSGGPGKCSQCGMDLVAAEGKKHTDHSQCNHAQCHHDHHAHSHHTQDKHTAGHDHTTGHDHTSMMASPAAAQDFLHRFYSVTALLLPLFAFGYMNLPLLQFVTATVIFYFGLVFLQHARHEIMARKYGMMTLVSIAVTAGYVFSALSTFLPSLEAEFYLEISTLIWVLLFGHFLEARSTTAAGNALQEVARLLPKKARLIENSEERSVESETLKAGDVVRVVAGEKVPADGIILSGSSHFNEAHISGESKPMLKAENDTVVAGSICLDGSVDIRLSRVGENSTIGQIQKLIAAASKTKPSAQRLADTAANWLTLIAVVVAVITVVIWFFVVGSSFAFALTLAITVLVIACPHALGLAIPTVSAIATRLAVKNGLFVKNMAKLEVAKNATYVVFDKTGTLTRGEFGVSQIRTRGVSEEKLLAIAASIESHSSHVIGQSIVKYAKQKGVKLQRVSSVKNIAGRGIEGSIAGKRYFVGRHGSLSVAVVLGKKVMGEIVLADEIKDESRQAVEQLHALGLKVAMLTGDSEAVAKEVSDALDIDTFFAQVLPEEKYKHVKNLQDEGHIVVMVGDGVNDAPALTQANVGVAVGAGTDVAVEAGDVVLTSSNPQDIVSFIRLARKVYAKMIQNLFWALGYNIVAIPAAAGLFMSWGFRLTPALGAFLMSVSSVIVVANALTLQRVKLRQ